MPNKSIVLLLLLATATLAQTPQVEPGGVVDAATFQAPVVPGSLVTIFGVNMAAQTASAATVPLPQSLGGASVTFNGVIAPLLYVSPGQINAQLPWQVSAAASVSVIVNNGTAASASQAVQVAPLAPGIYAISGHPVAINPDGTLAAPAGSVPGFTSHPASPSDTLVLLASGLGPVNPAGVTGNNSADALRNAATTPTVSIGGMPAQVTFAGLSPQFVGVYQVNVTMPDTALPGNAVSLQIAAGGLMSSSQPAISIGAGWPQWGQSPQHSSAVAVAGQGLAHILANIVYDPLVLAEQSAEFGELTVHYQAPLVDGNDVYMEFKSGTFDPNNFASQTWGENKFTWQNGQLTQQWSYSSDWKAPGSLNLFWEPVFHAALANGALYVPGAGGSLIEVDKATGAAVTRIAPFGSDPGTYESGPITVDAAGNLYYNAIQMASDGTTSGSWLVKVTPGGSSTMASYTTLTSPEAPGPSDQCLTTFGFAGAPLPWPPSPNAVPPTSPCGMQRVGLNIAPAVAPDGTVYTVSRADFNDRYSYLIAVNPDLSKKWAVSLRGRFNDGCGVPVSAGGWLPATGTLGGCNSGAPTGVDPETNLPGDGRVIDDASSTPVVAPDGTVLFGAYTRYNYSQGHMMHFDAAGNFLNSFGFGWDTTPAIYAHDGTWSMVTKNNHYGGVGSYCDVSTVCPSDRTSNNPASPEQYFVTQLNSQLNIEWSYQNTNTQNCMRNSDGSISCVSDHPNGFEWCVNSPVVDSNGVVYANSEDGNLYAIGQSGSALQMIFQQSALGAAYTPASLGGDGRIYSQNDGHLFVVGQ